MLITDPPPIWMGARNSCVVEGDCYRGVSLSDHVSESAAPAPVTETLPVNHALALSSFNISKMSLHSLLNMQHLLFIYLNCLI